MNISQKTMWTLAGGYAVLTVLGRLALLAVPTFLFVLLPILFALIHGTIRYGWRGMVAFIGICLVVSNALENTSILTGFPFGHYHYTAILGPKLFLVPVLIGLAYVSTGYLAWVIATALIGEVRRGASLFLTIAVPFIAAFSMVVWDVGFDPLASTVNHWWIWEQGGGYFGVPLTNYLGWFLTVFIFYQLFSLYLRVAARSQGASLSVPMTHYVQAICFYATLGIGPILTYVVNDSHGTVTDATGMAWNIHAIYETAAIVSIYTMLFISVLTAVKLLQ